MYWTGDSIVTHTHVALSWHPDEASPALTAALRTLALHYPIVESASSDNHIRFEHDAAMKGSIVERQGSVAIVRYHRMSDALRAVGSLLADLVKGSPRVEQDGLRQLGVMLDVSRGAVVTPEHFKRWLDRLALLGFNVAMLYTEDVYRLPDEPCFGYARGAYTADELCEIDDYANALGIEMIPCIQTLGHLEQVLKWWLYADVKDTDAVLLVDEDRTYELIGKMLDLWAKVFRSRRIHGCMDEAYPLGRGKFRDRFGHQPSIDIFLRHLHRIHAMCHERGLSLMIWSDMLFHLSSKTDQHYDPAAQIPDEVAAAIPPSVNLVYWDYYKNDKNGYKQVIERHRKLGFDPMVASAVTTPYRFWYDRHEMLRTALPCVDACKEAGVQSLIFTMWGDDGAYCDFDSALAGLAETAEHLHSPNSTQEDLAKRFDAVCHGNLEAHYVAAELHHLPGINTPGVLWDDPLLGIYLRSRRLCGEDTLTNAAKHYQNVATQLAPMQDQGGSGDIRHAQLLASLLAAKLSVADDLLVAYANKDHAALNGVAQRIEPLCGQFDALSQSFRAMWMARNKPFGLEVIQIRLAGLIERFRELKRRLDEIVNGTAMAIPELDEPSPGRHGYAHYQRLATGSARL